MVLIDTSIWVSHLKSGNFHLKGLLQDGKVVTHPFIIGELACGNLKKREEILSLLKALPAAATALHEEVLQLIENHRLMGLGLGYVDVHLLAAALLTAVPLWTHDKPLKEAAIKLQVAYGNA
jgi:predicted nucleic acid-binding protein